MTYRDPLLGELEREERARGLRWKMWGILGVVALVAAMLAVWSGPRKRPPVMEQVPVEILIDGEP